MATAERFSGALARLRMPVPAGGWAALITPVRRGTGINRATGDTRQFRRRLSCFRRRHHRLDRPLGPPFQRKTRPPPVTMHALDEKQEIPYCPPASSAFGVSLIDQLAPFQNLDRFCDLVVTFWPTAMQAVSEPHEIRVRSLDHAPGGFGVVWIHPAVPFQVSPKPGWSTPFKLYSTTATYSEGEGQKTPCRGDDTAPRFHARRDGNVP